jgi:SAM-dependent methyltransferase
METYFKHMDLPSFIYLTQDIADGHIDGGGADLLSYHIMQLLLERQNSSGLAGDVVEIGVWSGQTFTLLATTNRDGQSTIGIDISEAWLLTSKELATNICKKYGVDSVIQSIKGSSTHPHMAGLLQKAVGSHGLRFAHIDGEHSYALVYSDARLLQNFMSPWGIMCFDDCFSPACPGVIEALFKFSFESDWIPLLFTPNKAYLVNKRYFRFYRSFIIEMHKILTQARGMSIALSSSSYHPDEGHISVFYSDKIFYQVINHTFYSFQDFIAFRPEVNDVSSCSFI